VQSGRQLGRAVAVTIRKGNYAATVARFVERRNRLSRSVVSWIDDYERRHARARVQLPIRRPRDAGAVAANEVRSVAAAGGNDRRKNRPAFAGLRLGRQLLDRLGQTSLCNRRSGFGWLSRKIRNRESDFRFG